MALFARKAKLSGTCVSGAAYNMLTRKLDIDFVNGHRYRYTNVPRKVFKGLKSADSAGKYFNAHVRNSFNFEKLH